MMRVGCLCLILLIAQSVYAEERMGRLFMTPAERINLDYIRQSSKLPDKIIRPEVSVAVDEDVTAKAAPVSSVTMQGYVRRSDGKGTVWINHQPVRETSSEGEIQVGKVGTKDGKVKLKLPGVAKDVMLKAGQTYDPSSGAIVEHVRDLPPPEMPEPAAITGKINVPAVVAEPAKKP